MIQNLNSPLVTQWNTDSQGNKISVMIENEGHQVVDCKITLNQIPDKANKVQIDNMYEVNINKELDVNEFKCDYNTGIISFNSSREAQFIIIKKYYGRGVIYSPASRIYDNSTGQPLQTVDKTLQDYIDSLRPYGYKGEYNNTVIYQPNSSVLYSLGIYKCIKTSQGILPTNTEYWEVMLSVKEVSDYAKEQGDYAKQSADGILLYSEDFTPETITIDNDIAPLVQQKLGNLANLQTTSKDNLVNAINNVKTQLNENTNQSNGIASGKKLKKGILSFTFDNSFMSTYAKVFPEFKNRGIPFAVSPVAQSFAGAQKDPTYYTYENLKEMVAYGVEIIAHGLVGTVLETNATALVQAEHEIKECKKYWNKLGFKVNGYCGTNSAVNDVYKPFLQQNYDYSFAKYWSDKPVAQSVINENTDLYAMGRHSLYATYLAGGVNAIKAEIDYVEQNKVWLNYYNHQIDTGLSDSIPLTDLITILDYALSKNIEILLPTEAVQRLNAKLVATENIKRIRSEINDYDTKTNLNLLVNPEFNGGTAIPTSWGNRDTSVGGVTKAVVAYDNYNAIKYTLDSTDNTGKYIGLSQLTPLKSEKKADIITFSLEVDSSSSDVDFMVNMSLQTSTSTEINYISKTQQLVAGKKHYEVSLLLPNSDFAQLAFHFNFYPKVAGAMTIEFSKPKLERGRARTSWLPSINFVAQPSSSSITFTNLTDNNPTPDVTGKKYLLFLNPSATTVTNLVTTDYAQEITLFFGNANTTIKGTGNIRLTDNLDWTPVLGSVLTLIKTNALSTAWYEKSRAKR